MSQLLCPLCGQPNHCHADTDCWCMRVEVSDQRRQRILESDTPPQCLCKHCLLGTDVIHNPSDELTRDKK